MRNAITAMTLVGTALAAILLLPVTASLIGLDPSRESVELGLFLGLWSPALVVIAQATGLLPRGLGAFALGLLSGELLAVSALVSTWLLLALLWALAALLGWLSRGLGIPPEKRSRVRPHSSGGEGGA
jgi:hypothetical protein